MSKIRLTKNELKLQRDSLKRFERYLPLLILKKKQLQQEIIKTHGSIGGISVKINDLRNEVARWADVFCDDVSLKDFFNVGKVRIRGGNVAGIDIPVFSGVDFDEKEYDYLITPLWVDRALEVTKEMVSLHAQTAVLRRQLDILKEELRIATQRVNLFEKIKIPEAQENIRIIQIYLGELQTANVVRGKIAKAKIEQKKEMVL